MLPKQTCPRKPGLCIVQRTTAASNVFNAHMTVSKYHEPDWYLTAQSALNYWIAQRVNW